MARKSFPLSKVYGLLEPGPVVLVTTAGSEHPNIMAMSWHTMMEFEPPLVGCVISDRNYSFALLKETRECVINIPTVELVEKVVGCGNTSGAHVDKFAKFHLTPKPASMVGAPLIEECHANLECRVSDISMVETYCLFVLQVVKAWINPPGDESADNPSSWTGPLYGSGRKHQAAVKDEVAHEVLDANRKNDELLKRLDPEWGRWFDPWVSAWSSNHGLHGWTRIWNIRL